MQTEATPSGDDAEHQRRIAWLKTAKHLHRNKRMAGFACVVLGACLVAAWKLDGRVPDVALWGGVAALVAGWAIFVFVMVSRWLWVKKNPYRAGQ